MHQYRVAMLVHSPVERGHTILDRQQILSVYCFGESEDEAERISLERMEEAEIVEVETV